VLVIDFSFAAKPDLASFLSEAMSQQTTREMGVWQEFRRGNTTNSKEGHGDLQNRQKVALHTQGMAQGSGI
jgi:hypothetical protein